METEVAQGLKDLAWVSLVAGGRTLVALAAGFVLYGLLRRGLHKIEEGEDF